MVYRVYYTHIAKSTAEYLQVDYDRSAEFNILANNIIEALQKLKLNKQIKIKDIKCIKISSEYCRYVFNVGSYDHYEVEESGEIFDEVIRI